MTCQTAHSRLLSSFVLILFVYATCSTMNRNDDFIKEIFHYFIDDTSKYVPNNVIKRHSEKITEFGDYSFPITIQNWAHFVPSLRHSSYDNIFTYRQSRCGDVTQSIADQIQNFVQSSQQWPLQIERAVIKENRCIIFLNRCSAFHSTLHAVLNDQNFGCYEGNHSYVVIRNDSIPEEKELLTKYRCRVIQNVIGNLTKHLKGPVKSLLYVTHKSTDVDAPERSIHIFVGNVTSSDNKVLNVEADEYIKWVTVKNFLFKFTPTELCIILFPIQKTFGGHATDGAAQIRTESQKRGILSTFD